MSSSSQKFPPAQNETTSNDSPLSNNPILNTVTNKPNTDDAKTLKKGYDPNASETPLAETETLTAEFETPPAFTQTTSKYKDVETLKQPSPTDADADPHVQEVTPVTNETTSKDSSHPNNIFAQITATPKLETDENKTHEKEFPNIDADPHGQKVTPVKNETISKDASHPNYICTQTTATHEPETDGNKNLETEFPNIDVDPHVQKVTPVESETISKDSSHPNYISTQITATHEPETNENKNLENEFPNSDAYPHKHGTHEISPARDEIETTSKQFPPPKNDFSQTTGINDSKTLEAEPIKRGSSISDADYRSTIILKWKKLLHLFQKRSKGSQSKSLATRSLYEVELESPSKLTKAIQEDLDYVKKGGEMLNQYKNHLNLLLEDSKKLEKRRDEGRWKDFLELKQSLIKIRLQTPSKYRVDSHDSPTNIQLSSKSKQSITPEEVLTMMPQMHKNDVFESSPYFKDFEARYNMLHRELKLCLLCFPAFPENALIKKRLMVQWWVSEGFACEDVAHEYFLQLIDKGFIEPVNENRSLYVGSCRMHPFYRSALVVLAERAKFLKFGSEGEPTQDFSETFQACLLGQGLISFEDLKNELVTVDELEKIHLLINVDESILEFKRDWFSRMKNVNFLYLGRWKALATDHKEVEDTMFLDDLKNMNYVKFLSLQGVSNIIDLPESILKLMNLKILDIRACHNLETIPNGIGVLKWLTHLDMSDCYLLEHMPKSLSSLKELRVLKGFVVGKNTGVDKKMAKKSCTLDDLKELPNLIKLCIYTGWREFPNEQHVKALGNLERLRKLTITWGGSAFQAKIEERPDEEKNEERPDKARNEERPDKAKNESSIAGKLPLKLEKLDLRYFPTSNTPDWLALKNLKDLENLKKLYIRGGKFSDLGQYQDSDDWNWPVKRDTWTVKVLRLKYLPEIEMEWRQVQELFPDLVYLEQVGCPKLNLFPCDANGVWMNKKPE